MSYLVHIHLQYMILYMIPGTRNAQGKNNCKFQGPRSKLHVACAAHEIMRFEQLYILTYCRSRFCSSTNELVAHGRTLFVLESILLNLVLGLFGLLIDVALFIVVIIVAVMITGIATSHLRCPNE